MATRNLHGVDIFLTTLNGDHYSRIILVKFGKIPPSKLGEDVV